MATGIDGNKLNSVKLDLVDYLESINQLIDRYETCKSTIMSCMEGGMNRVIESKLSAIGEQLPNIYSNINGYIDVLNRVNISYEQQDREMSSLVHNDITEVERLKED